MNGMASFIVIGKCDGNICGKNCRCFWSKLACLFVGGQKNAVSNGLYPRRSWVEQLKGLISVARTKHLKIIDEWLSFCRSSFSSTWIALITSANWNDLFGHQNSSFLKCCYALIACSRLQVILVSRSLFVTGIGPKNPILKAERTIYGFSSWPFKKKLQSSSNNETREAAPFELEGIYAPFMSEIYVNFHRSSCAEKYMWVVRGFDDVCIGISRPL